MDRDKHRFPHHHRVKYEPHQHQQHHHHHRHHNDDDDDDDIHHHHQQRHQHHHHHHPRQQHHHRHHHHHPARPSAAEAEETARELHLEPFHHQVAGQSLVFCYDPYTICKSLIPRELQFYKTLPGVLATFVPRYKGIVDIPLKAPSSRQTGGTEEEEDDGGANHPLATQRLLSKVSRPRESLDNVYHFILLENIVAGMRRPCILDLKMGTRQHGDSAPPSKAQYQINKCRSTTSARLGVRLCGMKVYQCTTGDYLQVNKHEGRKMRKDDFREAMFQFLFNGRHFRRDLIGSLLVQLESLKAAIGQLPTYRFYSSSLLIVYDGLETERPPCCAGVPPSDRPDCDRNGIHELDADAPSCVDSPEPPEPCCDVISCDGFEAVPSCDVISCKRVEEVPSCDAASCGGGGGDDRDDDADDDDFEEGGVAVAPLCDVTSSNSVEEAGSPGDVPSRAASVEAEPPCCERAANGSSLAGPVVLAEESSQNGMVVDGSTGFPDEEGGDLANDLSATTTTTEELCRCRKCQFRAEEQRRHRQNDADGDDDDDAAVAAAAESAAEAPSSPSPTTGERRHHECRGAGSKLVVRMVDFAHTTFQGYDGDSVVHHGTDHGYLLGLQSVMDIFSALLHQ